MDGNGVPRRHDRRHQSCALTRDARSMVAERLSVMTRKRRFDIDAVLARIREAVIEHADAAMFELRDRGFGSVFQAAIQLRMSFSRAWTDL